MSHPQACGSSFIGVVGALLLAGISLAEEIVFPVTPAPTAAQRRIIEQLESRTRFEFLDTPLRDLVAYIEDLHDISVKFDSRSLNAAGIGTDTPVSCNIIDAPLRPTLLLVLNGIKLTYVIRDDALVITTPAGAEALSDVRVYDVASVLGRGDTAHELAKVLADVLRSSDVSSATPESLEAETRAVAEGKAARAIRAFEHMLIVRDTTLGHDELLNALKAIRTSQLLKAKADAGK